MSVDYFAEVQQAILNGDSETVEDAKHSWMRNSDLWTDGGKVKPDVGVQRKTAFQWLIALDNVLRQWVSENGIGFYILSEEFKQQNPNPLLWFVISITLDQGSDGWSAKQDVFYKLKASWYILPDVSHAVWNDFKRALQRSGLWPVVLLLSLMCDFSHKP